MAGCFGNHWVDRHLENELNQHLEDEQAFICKNCGYECDSDNCEFDETTEIEKCPKCGYWQEV